MDGVDHVKISVNNVKTEDDATGTILWSFGASCLTLVWSGPLVSTCDPSNTLCVEAIDDAVGTVLTGGASNRWNWNEYFF